MTIWEGTVQWCSECKAWSISHTCKNVMIVIINNSKSNISVIWRFFKKKIHYEWKLSWVVNKWYRFHLFLQFASSFLKLNISYTNMINSIVHRLVCLYFKFTPKYLTRILSQYPLRMLTNYCNSFTKEHLTDTCIWHNYLRLVSNYA